MRLGFVFDEEDLIDHRLEVRFRDILERRSCGVGDEIGVGRFPADDDA